MSENKVENKVDSTKSETPNITTDQLCDLLSELPITEVTINTEQNRAILNIKGAMNIAISGDQLQSIVMFICSTDSNEEKKVINLRILSRTFIMLNTRGIKRKDGSRALVSSNSDDTSSSTSSKDKLTLNPIPESQPVSDEESDESE